MEASSFFPPTVRALLLCLIFASTSSADVSTELSAGRSRPVSLSCSGAPGSLFELQFSGPPAHTKRLRLGTSGKRRIDLRRELKAGQGRLQGALRISGEVQCQGGVGSGKKQKKLRFEQAPVQQAKDEPSAAASPLTPPTVEPAVQGYGDFHSATNGPPLVQAVINPSPTPPLLPSFAPSPVPSPSPVRTPFASPSPLLVPSASPSSTPEASATPVGQGGTRQCEKEAADLTSNVEAKVLSESSSLDRRTKILTSTAVVSFKNISQEPLLGPGSYRVKVSFPVSGNSGLVQLNGAPMTGTPPGELISDLPLSDLAAGASTQITLAFARASNVRFSYNFQIYAKCPPTGGETSNPPRIIVPRTSFSLKMGEELSIPVSATDPDNDRVSLIAGPKLPNSTFSAFPQVNPQGVFKFRPAADQKGQFDVNFVARDAKGLSATQAVTISVESLNSAPTITGVTEAKVRAGEVLKLSLQVSDADNDAITIETSNLPAHSVFVEAGRSFSFAPTDEQVGEYLPRFIASDGSASSMPYVPQITVLPREGGSGQPSPLVLSVNPVSNPVLNARVRVTGSVNTDSLPPPFDPSVKLITSLVPSTVEQGKTVTVQLGGQGTSFKDGLTGFTFGDGIEIKSVAITSATGAMVQLEVDSSAAPGPRSVQAVTGDEAAVSVIALNVIPGKSVVKGVLKDPQTGAPIAGARITIEGTSFSVLSGADGSFQFFDGPSGPRTLIINAPNRDIQRIEVDAESGETVDLGELGTPSLVFDPSLPPSASIGSVLGRGAGDPTARMTFEEAKQITIDAILATGGDEGGALDEFGNQLNPLVTGPGLVSAPDGLLNDKAFRLVRGETRPLYEYLLGFSFAFEWQSGKRPSLLQWLSALQRKVNDAWQEPNKPENRIIVLIFSQGRTITPAAPTVTYETRLTSVQAYLLVSSWLAYSAKVAPLFAGNSVWERWSDALVTSAFAQTTPPTGQISSLTEYWRDINTKDFNDAYKGKVVESFGSGFGNAVLNAIGKEAQVPGLDGISSGIVGGFTDVLVAFMVKLNLMALTPQPPIILDAEKITERFASGEEFDTAVLFRITRTNGDNGASNPPGKRFIYRLFRRNPDGTFALVSEGQIPERRTDNDPKKGPYLDPHDPSKLIFIDYAPADGHNIYYASVERAIGENPDTSPPDLPLWTKFLPQPSFGIKAMPMLGSFNPVGTLVAVMGPLQSIANGIRKMSSPMSKPKAVWIGKAIRTSTIAAQGLAIDPNRRRVYVSYPAESRVDALDLDTLKTLESFSPGFKAPPAQSGLAVDFRGDLFSENAASDDSFGGKIFKYEQPTFGRSHVGMTNYFSFLLGYARPVSVPSMAIAPDDNLFVLDSVDRQVKKVPVRDTYDPYRRVGQPVLSGPLLSGVGANSDMSADFTGKVFISSGNNVIVGDLTNGGSRVFFSSSIPFQTIRSVATDGMHNLYISGAARDLNGSNTVEGIAVFSPTEQQLYSGVTDATGCVFDRHFFVRGLREAGLTRVHPRGRSVVFLDHSVPRFEGFGLSGQIRKADGSPLAGALVSVSGADFPSSKPVKTNSCGTYHILNLFDPDLDSRLVELTVSTPDLGSQKYLVGLESYGQTFRDIVFNPLSLEDRVVTERTFNPPPPVPTEVTINLPDPVIIPVEVTEEPPPIRDEDAPFPAQIITILSPLDLQKTSSTSGTVKGFVDDERVTTVYVATNGVEQEVPVVNQRFSVPVSFGNGMNYIVARAAITDDGKPVSGYSPRVRVEVDPNASGVGNVVGQIVDQSTGRAVAGVTVRLNATGDLTLTDVHGVYEFRDVPVGQTTVEIVENNGDPEAPIP